MTATAEVDVPITSTPPQQFQIGLPPPPSLHL